MKSEDMKILIVALLAVVAIVLASMSLVFWEVEEEDDDDNGGPNSPPTAQINLDVTTVDEFEIVYFNGSASTDSDGVIIEYTWDFGDGIKDSGMYSNHFYSLAGTYTVKLTVIDDKGDVDTDARVITVTELDGTGDNELPVAIITMETTTVEEEDHIYFNGSDSSDTDGMIIEYTWDFGDGIKDSGMYSKHIYKNNGSYNVTLTVIDDKGGKNTTEISIIITKKIEETTPTGCLSFHESAHTPCLYIGGFACLSETINLSVASIIIIDTSLAQSAVQDPINDSITFNVSGEMNCTYYDDNGNDMIDGADWIILYNTVVGDEIKFVYKPTGEVFAQYTFS